MRTTRFLLFYYKFPVKQHYKTDTVLGNLTGSDWILLALFCIFMYLIFLLFYPPVYCGLCQSYPWVTPGAYLVPVYFAIIPNLLGKCFASISYMFRSFKGTGYVRDMYGIYTRHQRIRYEENPTLVRSRGQ
jgi:hypothetical protein